MLIEGSGLHFPEVGMEDPFHPACPEDFVEREEGQENGSEESPEGLAMKDKAPKHQLGVPGDDRLIEVVEDKLVRLRHWKGNLRLV